MSHKYEREKDKDDNIQFNGTVSAQFSHSHWICLQFKPDKAFAFKQFQESSSRSADKSQTDVHVLGWTDGHQKGLSHTGM